ncbi:hypothetical protein [Sphingomonas sp. MMS24-J13]|uniref:hypothetical protein n=1 Tax=Sphingomonas sp. MMS24-J13 TaxID=3238686 RepID=UPI0038511498
MRHDLINTSGSRAYNGIIVVAEKTARAQGARTLLLETVMLKIHVAATDSRAPINEDAVGHFGDAAWVIDGATGIGASLLDAPSDASWLARTADAAFRTLLSDDPAISTRELVREAITLCRDALATNSVRDAEGPHEHPSAAFTMLRRIGDSVELTALADCKIAYRDADGMAQLFASTTFDAIEGRTLALTRELLTAEPEISSATLVERLLPQLQANRRQMNQPGGYWVLGTEPAAADHLATLTLPARPGQDSRWQATVSCG